MIAGGILGITGLRPPRSRKRNQPARRPSTWRRRWATISPAARWATVAALAAGLIVAALTGWVIAIVVLPVAVLGMPVLLASPADTGRIGGWTGSREWTRNSSGVLVAGQGTGTGAHGDLRSCSTPSARRSPVWWRGYGDGGPTEAALRAFADDLDDATGDLVAALILGSCARSGVGRHADRPGRVGRGRRRAWRARSRPTGQTTHDRPSGALLSAGALRPWRWPVRSWSPYRTPLGQVIPAGAARLLHGVARLVEEGGASPPSVRFLGVQR